jgi:hypothetical protein
VSEEISRLKDKTLPYPLSLPDLAIADFDLFGVLKQKLQGIDVGDGEELNSEILTIFQGIASHQLNKSFDHWIERCQWVAANAKKYHPSLPESVIFILSIHFSWMPMRKAYWTTDIDPKLDAENWMDSGEIAQNHGQFEKLCCFKPSHVPVLQ